MPAGIIHVACPRCHLDLCSGICEDVAVARRRYATNVSFCLVCRQWFKWADAAISAREPKSDCA